MSWKRLLFVREASFIAYVLLSLRLHFCQQRYTFFIYKSRVGEKFFPTTPIFFLHSMKTHARFLGERYLVTYRKAIDQIIRSIAFVVIVIENYHQGLLVRITTPTIATNTNCIAVANATWSLEFLVYTSTFAIFTSAAAISWVTVLPFLLLGGRRGAAWSGSSVNGSIGEIYSWTCRIVTAWGVIETAVTGSGYILHRL